MKPATQFVRRYRDVLANRPVWLFSSGPLGSEARDAQGGDKRDIAEPEEIAEFRQTIRPRDHRVFLGALDPNKLGFIHRLMLKLPANRDNALFPVGDFRDWNDVEAWANTIAQAVTPVANAAT
jgi:menaquinone-dependent protoporphyrinogen oxidase